MIACEVHIPVYLGTCILALGATVLVAVVGSLVNAGLRYIDRGITWPTVGKALVVVFALLAVAANAFYYSYPSAPHDDSKHEREASGEETLVEY